MSRFLKSVWGIAGVAACLGIAVVGVGCGGEAASDRGGLRFEGTEPGDCSDDADNDADGLFDCDDSGCAGSSVCSDGGTGGFGGMVGAGGTGGTGGAAGTGGNGGVGGVAGAGGVGGAAGAGGTPLDCATLTNPPSGCEETCPSGSDSECELGTFCLNGVCSAQCTADEGCGAGSSCNVRGRCVPDIGTGGTGGSSCQWAQIVPTRSIPNVAILLDQSGSMTTSFGGGLDRWEAAHGAITQVVSDLDSIVRFGLTTYQSADGGSTPAQCPIFDTQVGFAMDNFGAINVSFPASFPGGEDTPTGDSIDVLVDIIQANPPPAEGSTIIVLATDGEPDTCETPDPNPTQEAYDEAIAAAQNAFNVDPMDPNDFEIQTFILSVGNDVSDAHLQDMANAGVGKPVEESVDPAPFWKATTPQGLENAFNEIIGASISCDIQMDKLFDDVDKACAEGDLRLNGSPLDCPTEWQVKPGVDDVIELVDDPMVDDDACDTFKSGAVTFTATFPCGAIVIE